MNFMPAAYRWTWEMPVLWVVQWNDALWKQAYCSCELCTLSQSSKSSLDFHKCGSQGAADSVKKSQQQTLACVFLSIMDEESLETESLLDEPA